MMCPVCNEPLVVLEMEGVEIDRCFSCGGIWLDAGEMEFIAGSAGADVEKLQRALWSGEKSPEPGRKCPRCGKKMNELNVGEKKKVTIDRCPRGQGIWLDKGELQTLLCHEQGQAREAIAEFLSNFIRADIECSSKDSPGPAGSGQQ